MKQWFQWLKNALKIDGRPPTDPALNDWLGAGSYTNSGARVTMDNSMQVAAVFACVQAVSDAAAMLPLITYQEQGRGKERAFDHYLYNILKTRPNSFQSPFEFKHMMQAHLELRGNAYAQIVGGGYKQAVKELIPLHPDRVQPFWFNKKPFYRYISPDNEPITFAQSDILHLRTFCLKDPLIGMSRIEYHRETIGLSMTTQEHGARVFSNGTNIGGLLQHPGKLSKDAAERLAESWDKKYQGIKKAGKTALLEEGMTYKEMGISPKDAQYIESQKFNAEQIASIFGVPPHKIGLLDKATFSNIEQQSLEFVTNTMMPRLVVWEEAINRSLVFQDGMFVKFLVNALLRGDVKSRNEAYAIGRQWGWYSANDIRELEDMNPIEEGGDTYLVPLNMLPSDIKWSDTQNGNKK